MSGGARCRCEPPSARRWAVTQRYCNHSAFNGYHRTSSNYSAVFCFTCRRSWRTKANYVGTLPDAVWGEGGYRYPEKGETI